ELWQKLGHQESITYAQWPTYHEEDLITDNVEVILQVNGKLRDKITVPIDTPKEQLQKLALQNQHLQKFIADKKVAKVIVVPNKIVNIVVK
ncbi:leucine--tRNA ligase, partial [Lactobacillus sp. XV13L]|nr:leucine--tRNA ligase [Lactobacillus sp. XV13L]